MLSQARVRTRGKRVGSRWIGALNWSSFGLWAGRGGVRAWSSKCVCGFTCEETPKGEREPQIWSLLASLPSSSSLLHTYIRTFPPSLCLSSPSRIPHPSLLSLSRPLCPRSEGRDRSHERLFLEPSWIDFLPRRFFFLSQVSPYRSVPFILFHHLLLSQSFFLFKFNFV